MTKSRIAHGLGRTITLVALAVLIAAGAQTAIAGSGDASSANIKADGIRVVLKQAFDAALKGDFDAYLKTVHPEERSNATQRSEIKRYSWKRFAKQASWYLAGSDTSSFEITKREDTSTDEVRVFLKDKEHKTRMPVPVRFKRLTDGTGGYGIIANSL